MPDSHRTPVPGSRASNFVLLCQTLRGNWNPGNDMHRCQPYRHLFVKSAYHIIMNRASHRLSNLLLLSFTLRQLKLAQLLNFKLKPTGPLPLSNIPMAQLPIAVTINSKLNFQLLLLPQIQLPTAITISTIPLFTSTMARRQATGFGPVSASDASEC